MEPAATRPGTPATGIPGTRPLPTVTRIQDPRLPTRNTQMPKPHGIGSEPPLPAATGAHPQVCAHAARNASKAPPDASISDWAAKPCTAVTVTEGGCSLPSLAAVPATASSASLRTLTIRSSSAGTVMGLPVQELAVTALTVRTVSGAFRKAASCIAHSSA